MPGQSNPVAHRDSPSATSDTAQRGTLPPSSGQQPSYKHPLLAMQRAHQRTPLSVSARPNMTGKPR